jgi:hypothetical protein
VGVDPLALAPPLSGPWVVRNSPADRVPSHGTHALGTTYAIDLVPVDDRGRSARRGWRSWVSTEAPEAFVGFGLEVIAPVSGRVVQVHDGEPDHVARRAPIAGLAYALTQARRVRAGVAAVAGNHVVVEVETGGPFVLVAHLRRGSVAVAPGDPVVVGDPVGRVGNSGNSIEPHVHLQVNDSTDWERARGLPLAFAVAGRTWVPRAGEVVVG